MVKFNVNHAPVPLCPTSFQIFQKLRLDRDSHGETTAKLLRNHQRNPLSAPGQLGAAVLFAACGVMELYVWKQAHGTAELEVIFFGQNDDGDDKECVLP